MTVTTIEPRGLHPDPEAELASCTWAASRRRPRPPVGPPRLGAAAAVLDNVRP